MPHDSASHDVVRAEQSEDVANAVRLTTERKAQLVALVELDRDMTIDEIMFLAGAYEDLANRKHAKRNSEQRSAGRSV